MNLVELRIRNPQSIEFYKGVLGMRELAPNLLECSPGSTKIRCLVEPQAPQHNASLQDGFWKLGLALPDVDKAVTKLRESGVEVSKPSQFRDIGYLAHFRDPEGLSWELLAHRFHGKVEVDAQSEHPLGSDPTLGQITLRVSNPEKSLSFYTETLGMTLLSVQKVEPYRFTLYFLAITKERPPDKNLESVDNREWLWQRPYTTLELQHRWEQSVQPADRGGPGFVCLEFGEGGETCLDPDGHRLRWL